MNLKLNEWNIACEYATEICRKLEKKEYNVKVEPYSVCDNKKGIYLQVFDNLGYFFTQYATGIHNNLEDMKKAIDIMATRIITEC